MRELISERLTLVRYDRRSRAWEAASPPGWLADLVLGGAVALTGQLQNGYRRQLEDSVGEQEARYAMDWINRYLRSVGNNPFNATQSDCPGANTIFYGLIMDPNGDGVNDDITLQSDSNPPDGKIGGTAGNCTQANENVTISYSDTDHAITFLDEAVARRPRHVPTA